MTMMKNRGAEPEAGSFADIVAFAKGKGHKVLEVLTYDDDGEHSGEIIALKKNGNTTRYEFSGRVASAELEAAAEGIYKQQAKADLAALNEKYAKQEQEAAPEMKAEPPTESFEKVVNDIRARDRCSKQDAMRQGRREHPEAFAAYQEGDEPSGDDVAELLAKRRVTAKAFGDRVNEVKQRDKCSKQDAMRTARREFPDEFAAFQSH